MRSETPLAIYVELDRDSAEPMVAQLVRQLRQAIVEGRFPAGSRLPSSRTLAGLLGVSRPVVQEAYRTLQAEDRIESRQGSGTYVKRARSGRAAVRERAARTAEPARAAVVDLSPDQPSGEDFPVPVWRAAWRRATHRIPEPAPGPGEAALRAAVAEHLRGVRGLAVDAENVLITTGARQSLDMVAAIAMRPGGVTAVEDPCLPTVIRLLRQHGVTTVPVRLDAEGAVPESVPPAAEAVVVRPSHQMPLGVELPPARRRELVDLAVARGLLIVEDDRDHDFTELVRPPALWDLTRGRTDEVVYVGCLCRLLPDVVCTGYLLARGRLLRELADHLALRQSGTVAVAQRAVAELLDSAELRCRIGRLRQAYQAKRHLVAEALAGHPAVAGLNGAHSGSHVYVELREAVSAARAARAFRRDGVIVPTVDVYEWSGRTVPRNGFLIAHNHLDAAQLARPLETLVRVLDRRTAVCLC